MKKSTFNTLLVGGGFLLGTAGIKLLTSAPVKNACVQGIACGMRIKNGYQDMDFLPARLAPQPPDVLWEASSVSACRFSGAFRCPPTST